MTIWIIEPHDPLIVRDGRPFSATPGVQAESLPFPFPSTTTGGVRTRAGLKDDIFDIAMTQEVKKITVRGPLLIELLSNNGTEQIKWLVPAPADALIFEPDPEKKRSVLQRLVPLLHVQGAVTDFDGKQPHLVGLSIADVRKPSKKIPHYWYWDKFEQWLLNPTKLQEQENLPDSLGHNGPSREHRTHVSMELDQRIAKEGALFGTSGLEFTASGHKEKKLQEAQRLALVVAVDDSKATELKPPGIQAGIASLGGERRMVSWRKSNNDLPLCPPETQEAVVEIREAIVKHRACRVILLTPAYFERGYYPTWLTKEHYGVTPQLAGIAIQRPQIVSGWQLEKPVGPKPTRRLAPAGTVIFLNLEGNEVAAIRDWVNKMWMQCVSDDDPTGRSTQSRDDGFGLAVLGTWSGDPIPMQKEQQS